MNRPNWMKRSWWSSFPKSLWTFWISTRLSPWLRRSWKRPSWTTSHWWSPKLPLTGAYGAWQLIIIFIFKIFNYFSYVFERAWWRTWYHHPDLENPREDDAHWEAAEWVLGYTPGRPEDGEVYNSALKYAERQYDQSVKINEAIDKKLDDLWRNASTIGTILAAAAKLFPMTAPVAASPLMVAALIFLAVTVILSAYTRGPASMAVPTNTRSILAVIESDPPPSKAQVEGVEAASYHFATIGMTRVNLWKSRQTKRATVLFCTGLMFLVLAMLFASPQPSSPPSSSLDDPSSSERGPAARPTP
jgi:hypothetical protein